MAYGQVELDEGEGGNLIAVDTIDGQDFQRGKFCIGVEGTAVDVSSDNPMPVTCLGTVAVSAASLPLPSGAATSALQTTGNAALSAIQTAVEALDNTVSGSELQVDIVAAVPAGDNAIGRVKLTDGTDVAEVTAANALKVDASATTQPVSGTVNVTGVATAANQTTELAHLAAIETAVEGTLAVAVSSLPNEGQQTMASSISVAIASNQSAVPVSAASLPLPSGASTLAEQQTQSTALAAIQTATEILDNAISGSEMQVDVVGALPAGDAAIGRVKLTDGTDVAEVTAANALKVDGSAVTQPVSGTVTANAGSGTMAVSAAALPLPSGASSLAEQQTQTTALAAIQAAVQVLDNAVSGSELQVDVLTMPAISGSVTVSSGSVAATQSGNWGVRCQDGSGNALTSKSVGAERAISVAIVDGSGDQVTSFGGGTQYTEDAASVANPVGGALMMVRDDALSGQTSDDGDNVAARGTDKGELYVKHADAITANAGTDLNTSLLALEGGGNLAACATSLAAIDNAVAGSELQVDVVAALPAGTNAIGKLAANSGVDIGDVDVTSMPGTAAEGAALPAAFVVVAADDGTDTQPLQLSAAGDLKITLDSEAVVLGAGSAAIGKLAANDGVDIGNVDVASLPNVTLASTTNTIEVVGDAAAGATAAGNPLMMGLRADTTAPTAVSDGQVVHGWGDEYGAAWVKPSLNQVSIRVTPTIDTNVYQSGDRLGSVMTFANAALVSGRSGTIVGALLEDEAASAFDIRLHIFKVSPTLVNADNGALQITDANLATALYVGTIEFTAANGHSFVDNRVVQGTYLGGPVAIPFVTSGSSSLFGILEARGAYDAAAADDLVVTITCVRD